MSRRGENIYKRKDNRWEGRYKKGRKSNGQLKYGYIYGKTYGEVKERLYVFKVKYQTLIQLQGECTLTYEEWGRIWLKQQQFTTKPYTYSAYLYKLTRYVFPIIGTTALNQITKQTIQTVIDTWQEQLLQPSTIQVLYQIMKKSLKDAHEQQQILTLPCQQIRLPKKKKPTVKALSTLEQQQLEKKAKALPPYKGLPVLLALDAGLRIGGISALRWEDVDLNNRMIYVKKTYQRLPIAGSKTKTQLVLDSSKTDQSIRVVPMTFSLYKYLKKWKKKAPGTFVCSNKITPSEPRLLTYYFHRIRKMCGIPSTHFHHLRHTFATRCIEANGDIASVSKLLGHASTQTTLDVYTDSLVESRQRVIQQMEEKKEKI